MNVLSIPIPDGYELVFVFTLAIIFTKILLGTIIAWKVWSRRGEERKIAQDFLVSVMLLMFLWALSRVFYMIFDFFLTRFDLDTYVLFPNIWFWKVGSFSSAVGTGLVVGIIDLKILAAKFKGVFMLLILSMAAVQLIYPVNNLDDFYLVSSLGAIAGFGALLVPIMFFWIGSKTPGLRKISWSIAFGGIIYAVGNSLPNQLFFDIFIGLGISTDFLYFLSTSLKIIGLLLISYGGLHFHV